MDEQTHAAHEAAEDLGYDAKDVSLGRWDFYGRREVFAGSRYIGCVTDAGVFVNDRRKAQ